MKLRGTSQQVTEADVAEFEARLRARLPDDYRMFLMTSNGGYLEGSYRFQISADEGASILQQFYRLRDVPGSTSTLDYMGRLYATRLPEALISIGSDAGGGKICMRVRGPGFGAIYYWDPGADYDDTAEGSFENIHEVAPSFSNFIEHLKLAA